MTGSAVTTVPASASPTDPCLSALSETLGADLFVQDEDARAACLRDMTGNWPSGAQAVARPRSTAEVGRLVQAAAAQGIAIVPQGGNTGLVGGCAVPAETPALLLSTRRLRSIRAIDLHAPAVIAEAGCILAEVQEAVAAHGFTIPLGLGSEGSATIGGLVSTNAGGIRALRHGVMRNQVLGLEVVLPDGRVWNGLRTLAKNNMGYDLKQLFVGGEGTLGVVTAAALRLVPASRQIETLWLAVEDPAAALALLGALRTALGDLVTSFELIQRRGVEWGMAAVPGLRVPDSGAHGWFVLAEVATAATGLPLRAAVESALADVFEQGLALDGMLANDLRGAWRGPADAGSRRGRARRGRTRPDPCGQTRTRSAQPDESRRGDRTLVAEHEARVDLDRDTEGQCGHAYRGAAMPPALAEHRDDEPAGTADDLALLGEVGRAGDKSVELQAAIDAIRVVVRRLRQPCEDVERAQFRRLRAVG